MRSHCISSIQLFYPTWRRCSTDKIREIESFTSRNVLKSSDASFYGRGLEYTQTFGPFAPPTRHLASLPTYPQVSHPVRSSRKRTGSKETSVSSFKEKKSRAFLCHVSAFTACRKLQLSFSASNGRSYATSATGNIISDVQTSAHGGGESILHTSPCSQGNIRDHLMIWQEQVKTNVDETTQLKTKTSTLGSLYNPLTVSGDDDSLLRTDRDDASLENEPNRISLSTDEFFGLADDNFFLRPGDVVELQYHEQPILAVFVQALTNQSQFYTMYGKWVHRTPRRVLFAIQQMVRPEDLRPIIPYLPKEDIPVEKLDMLHSMDQNVPREAGVEIIEKLLAFYRSTNEITRSCASKLKRIHDLVALPAERSFATLQEIALKVMHKDDPADLTDSMLWAVHISMAKNKHFFRPNQRNHRLYPLWDIISKGDAKSMDEVRIWMREYQEGVTNDVLEIRPIGYPNSNPFPDFIRKAQALVHDSRKTRMLTHSGCIGPSVVKVEPSSPDWAVWRARPSSSAIFTRKESQIIQFLHAWASTDSIGASSILASIGSLIIRATKMYEGFELGKSTGFLFLQELGTVPPWLNRESFIPKLPLPSHGVDPLTDRLHLEASKSTAGFQIEDSMKGLRRDWGDLEVFCIDDAEATEIDDGISLEQIDESASTFWVHVHVANPTAFLAPSSSVGRYASHLMESVYFPERVYHLLPQEITQNHFSLAAHRPCITFSAMITTTGDVIDTKISHGIINNVTSITPEALRRELGFERVGESQEVKITVGGEIPLRHYRSKPPPLLPAQIRSLHKLCDLAAARRRKKEQEGALSYQSQMIASEVGVYLDRADNTKGPCSILAITNKGAESASHLNRTRSTRYEGDPIITLRVKAPSQGPYSPSLSDELVPQMMMLAGEVGASWCAKRNIPIAYRGTALRPDPPKSPEQFKKDIIDPLLFNNAELPIGILHEYTRLLGKTVLSPVPMRHIILGTAAYGRLTSPLRRFADMMGHWQIEAAIRQESRAGASLIGSSDDSYLPFPRFDADSMIRRISVRESVISEAKDFARRHWVQQFLVRALHFKEANLPETFKLYIVSDANFSVSHTGWMKELGIAFDMPENQVTESEGGVRTGDCWEVKIKDIDCYRRNSFTEAIRLIERTDILGDESRKKSMASSQYGAQEHGTRSSAS